MVGRDGKEKKSIYCQHRCFHTSKHVFVLEHNENVQISRKLNHFHKCTGKKVNVIIRGTP